MFSPLIESSVPSGASTVTGVFGTTDTDVVAPGRTRTSTEPRYPSDSLTSSSVCLPGLSISFSISVEPTSLPSSRMSSCTGDSTDAHPA